MEILQSYLKKLQEAEQVKTRLEETYQQVIGRINGLKELINERNAFLKEQENKEKKPSKKKKK